MGIHFNRGQTLFALQRYEEALAEYQQELAFHPNNVASKANLASSLINLGRLIEARAAVCEALAMSPQYGFAFYLLSFVEPNRGRQSAALRAIREALRIEPYEERNVTRLGCLLRELERYEECLKVTDRALELNPRSVDALILRARTLETLNRHDEAAEVLRQALAINPESADAHLALGTVSLSSGDPHEALQALREARRLSPVTHNRSDEILEADARGVWIFRHIDAGIKRWKRSLPLLKWTVYVVVYSFLLWLNVLIRPTSRTPSTGLAILYASLANFLFFIVFAPQYAMLLVRVRSRREHHLRRLAAFGENLRIIFLLTAAQAVVTFLAIGLSYEASASYGTFSVALAGPVLFRMLRGVRISESTKPHPLGILFFTFALIGPPAVIGAAAFSERFWGLAWGVWIAILIFTFVEAAYRTWLARRRRG
jgi:tetratricopeptide (TPR) repeat protein